jgi:hypothetical protein
MAELNDIISMRVPVTFDWNGTEIQIAYRPYSQRIEQEVKGGEDWTQESMKALVVRVALDWNITSGGKPVPIDLDTLEQLPTELQMSLFYAVLNDVRNPTLPTVTKSNSAAI